MALNPLNSGNLEQLALKGLMCCTLCRECVASCPKSTYETSGVCESCPLRCDECIADADNQSVVCLSCIVGRYLVSIDNVTSCTDLCPERHYAGKTTVTDGTVLQILINSLNLVLTGFVQPTYFLWTL